MMFADELMFCFEKEVNNKKNSVKINEEFLFWTFIGVINKAALRNGYSANVLEIHKSCINFEKINRFLFCNKIVSTFSISSYNFSNCRYILIL